MGKTILYHGSDHIVHRPVYGGGKKNNDYGQGFYCTESFDMAGEWAVDSGRDGYVNSYSIDLGRMKVLNINSGEYSVLHWLSVLISNRTFELSTPMARAGKRYLLEHFNIDPSGFDLIRGYRADDSYFSFAQDFLNGTISVRQLKEAMRLGQLGEQLMIRSEAAFDALEELDAYPVSWEEWYPRRKERDALARKRYTETDKETWIKGDIYIARILDEEMKHGDERLL